MPLGTLAATGLAAVAFTAAPPHHHRHYVHHPECSTQRCADAGDRRWWKHVGLKRWRSAHPVVSGLEACIIEHESGGDPNAVSGKYSGIGQWEQSRWESDGGLRYASTPTGATYAEQERILRGEGEAGMIEQQGQYDGCG